MIPTSLVRRALWFTTVLNAVGAAGAVLAPAMHARMMLGHDVVLTGLLWRYHLMLWLFVGAMAVGYGIAATDPERHLALVVTGGLGKLAAVAVWLEMVVDHLGTPMLLTGVLFDGTLGVLFLAWAAQRAR